jgi:NAD(P)-dependent dehydrogenase (short-subunit alcohol dehydrogenase family)
MVTSIRSLAGQVALVTGSGSGLGRCTSLLLAQRGASIGAVDVDADAAKRTASEIEAAGGQALGMGADVRRGANVRDAVASLDSAFGRLDVVVANAGIVGKQARHTEDVEEDDWDSVIDVNLKGVFLTLKHSLPVLKRGSGGSVIAVSSQAALLPFVLTGAYGPSKAGVITFIRDLALELAEFNIRANSIAPGGMNTAFGRSTATSAGPPRSESEVEAWKEGVKRSHPIAPSDEPWDVAATIAFLASPEASYITGQCLGVDGGLGIQPSPNPLHAAS